MLILLRQVVKWWPVSASWEKTVLSEPSLCGHLLQFLLSVLWWPDSASSIKATNILGPIVKYWAGLDPRNSSVFPNSENASLCLSHLLNGIQMLGQHEENLTALIHLGVLMYTTLFCLFILPSCPN